VAYELSYTAASGKFDFYIDNEVRFRYPTDCCIRLLGITEFWAATYAST